MKWIIVNMLSVILFLVGAFFLWHDKEGWGWFVFAGFLAMHTFDSNEGDKGDKNDNI